MLQPLKKKLGFFLPAIRFPEGSAVWEPYNGTAPYGSETGMAIWNRTTELLRTVPKRGRPFGTVQRNCSVRFRSGDGHLEPYFRELASAVPGKTPHCLGNSPATDGIQEVGYLEFLLFETLCILPLLPVQYLHLKLLRQKEKVAKSIDP